MWHNTDINEVGYYLKRESVPLCKNESDSTLHDFTGEQLPNYYHMKGGDGVNITELEYCLQITHEKEFKWNNRDFTVGLDMIDNFVRTFHSTGKNDSSTSSEFDFGCDTWQKRGESKGFVLYNLWCINDGEEAPSAHHYYQKD